MMKQAFEEFRIGLQLQEQKQDSQVNHFHRCVSILLPQFEHSIRRIFVACNNLSEFYVKAQSRIHYTTLDMFINRVLDLEEAEVGNLEVNESKPPNLFHEEIGATLVDALYDLFAYPEGPRLRDKIAHCDADIYSIGRILPDRLCGLVLYLAIKYDLRNTSWSGEEYILNLDPTSKRVVEFFNQYKPNFHPKTLLYKELLQCWNSLLQFKELFEQTLLDEPSTICEDSELLWMYTKRDDYQDSEEELTSLANKIQERIGRKDWDLQSMKSVEVNQTEFQNKLINSAHLDTKTNSSIELSKVQLLRKQIAIWNQVCLRLHEKLRDLRKDVKEGKATRRAEDSLYKLIGSVRHLSLLVMLFMLFSEEIFLNFKDNNLKLLKLCLSTSQNTCTKIADNQWVVIIGFMTKLLPEFIKRYSS